MIDFQMLQYFIKNNIANCLLIIAECNTFAL